MSLVAWFPLNGTTKNQGLQDLTLIDAHNTPSSVASTPGKVTQQCYYNGNFSTGGYVTTTKVNLGLNQSMFAWISFSTLTSSSSLGGCVVGTHRYPTNTGMGITIKYVSSTTGYLSVNTGNGSSRTFNTYRGSTLLYSSTWYHVGYTFDGTTIRLYVNGKLDGSFTNSVITAMSVPEDFLVVGCWSLGTSTLTSNSVYASYKLSGYINDVRVYDHTLTQKEITELSKGLILHYNFEPILKQTSTTLVPTTVSGLVNLGKTSASYSNMTEGSAYSASGWGGDTGTCTYYRSRGYNNYPYKVYHKTATGTGGIYKKTANDIVIEANKTYTMSVYVKASVNVSGASAYSFNINRGSDNNYINYGSSFNITTEWKRLIKTFTATSAQAGDYGEMSIIYDDIVTDYYIYYSGFQIEEGSVATAYSSPVTGSGEIIDSSGYNHNGTPYGDWTYISDTASGNHAVSIYGSSSYIASPMWRWPDFTISMWVKRLANSGTREFLYTGWPGITIELTTANTILFQIWNNSSQQVGVSGGSLTVASGWTHICCTFDENYTRLYINGTYIDRYFTGLLNSSVATTANLGKYSEYYFEGIYADCKIYATNLARDVDGTEYSETVWREYARKTAIDSAGNLYTGQFVEQNNSIQLADKNNQVKATSFTEGTTATKLYKTKVVSAKQLYEL